MIKFILRKFIIMIPKILVISLILFCALDALPGDPLTRAVSPSEYAKMTEKDKDAFRESMGLNDPLPVRYITWLGNILKGDCGYSQSTGENIGKMLAGTLPFTIELMLWGLIVSGVFGILLGFLAAIKKNTIIDYLCTTVSVVGVSFPDFLFGIVFVLLFALKLKWFPTGGRMPVGEYDFWDRVPYMVLPVLALSVGLLATLTRYTRGSMLDVLNKEYIKTARSKGLREVVVQIKHGFRNALIPIVTLLCARIPMLVGGSVVVETVFNYPAIGTMVIDALNAGDIPVVMVSIVMTSVLVLVTSFLMDILAAALDPRVRLE